MYCYLENNGNKSKTSVVKHFVALGYSRSTIYDIITRYESGIGTNRQIESKIFDENAIEELKDMMDHQCTISQRKVARNFECSQALVHKVLKRSTKIRCFKKRVIPNRSANQRIAARKKCATLYRKYRKCVWILDDENYFTLSYSKLSANSKFYSSDLKRTPANVKYTKKAKYEKKVLVWLAMSPAGFSKPYIVPSGLAMNQKIYVAECLSANLLPFIKKHHGQDDYVFWSDLASAHYAESAIDFLCENLINHVDKPDNPANVPEIRSIEKFWALLKAEVYKEGWEARNLKELEKKYFFILKTLITVES